MRRIIVSAITFVICITAFANTNVGDSISVITGEYGAVMVHDRVNQHKLLDPNSKYNKADFLAGFKYILDVDTNKIAYYDGIQLGMSLMGFMTTLTNDFSIPLDHNKLYLAFEKLYMQDSITNPNHYKQVFQGIQQMLQDEVASSALNTNIYKENIVKGKKYIDGMVERGGYKLSPSGIAYKIIKEGATRKIRPTDKIAILYKGHKIDGEIFDETMDDPYESSASVFVPGFNEALTMIGKGGKISVIIPSDQAYGEAGADDIIEPGETLIFDIEVVSVTPR